MSDTHSKCEWALGNVPYKSVAVCNILSRPIDFNGLLVVTLKRDLRYGSYAWFGPVHPRVIYQKLNYIKSNDKFSKDITISKC